MKCIPDRPSEIVSGGYDSAILHFDIGQGSILSRFDIGECIAACLLVLASETHFSYVINPFQPHHHLQRESRFHHRSCSPYLSVHLAFLSPVLQTAEHGLAEAAKSDPTGRRKDHESGKVFGKTMGSGCR